MRLRLSSFGARNQVIMLMSSLVVMSCGYKWHNVHFVSTNHAPRLVPVGVGGETHREFSMHAQHGTALVLGSGGIRGFSHVGVMEVLEELGIYPDIVIGTSAGSIFGAMYAGGVEIPKIKKICLELKLSDVFDFTLSWHGFVIGKRLRKQMNLLLEGKMIEELPRKFFAVATDVVSGDMSIFSSGDPGLAVQASSSIPNVFMPVEVNNRLLVDGDLVSPVPMKFAERIGAKRLIVVDLSDEFTHHEVRWPSLLLLHAYRVLRRNNIAIEKKRVGIPMVVITPKHIKSSVDFSLKARLQLIANGRQAAEEQKEQLLKLVGF